MREIEEMIDSGWSRGLRCGRYKKGKGTKRDSAFVGGGERGGRRKVAKTRAHVRFLPPAEQLTELLKGSNLDRSV